MACISILAACGGGGGGTASAIEAPGTGGGGASSGGGTSPTPQDTTINGLTVPVAPDPAANAATVAGVDSNANGLRDDVERSLAATASGAAQYQATVQVAVKLQAVATNPPTTVQQAKDLLRAMQCAHIAAFESGVAPQDALLLVLNTPERRAAFNQAAALVPAGTEAELGACS